MNVSRLSQMVVRDVVSLEHLVAARCDLKHLAANYDDLKLDTPEWVVDMLKEVEREIGERTRAEKQARLKKLQARRAGLMTADEKRANLDKEIEELMKQV